MALFDSAARAEAQDTPPQRIEALERDVVLIKGSVELVKEAVYAVGSVSTAALVFFGYLSWRAQRRAEEREERERRFYEEGRRIERENYTRERDFFENDARRRSHVESQLSKQQIQMGVKSVAKFDDLLTAQAANIQAIGSVLEVIAKASNIHLTREEGHEKFEKMIEDLRTGAERRYQFARDEADRLRDVKGYQWPTLPEDRRRTAISALSAYRAVDDFIKVEKTEKEPAKHATLLQRLGVFAYYADYDVDGSIEYLSDAVKLFGDQPADDQFKPGQAWARHFLAVLKKNWPLRLEVPGSSLRQAQGLLAAAEAYLSIEAGQFLTPLTHAEVLSYLDGDKKAAIEKVTRITQLIEERRDKKLADSVQLGLLPRAYLLRGNLSQMNGNTAEACEYFKTATELDERNAYAWLSRAEVTPPSADARSGWQTGLSLLPSPPAREKPETSARVLVFSWGILAAHAVGNKLLFDSYRAALDEIGAVLEKDGKYTALFFSPITKRLADFDQLNRQLSDKINIMSPV
ncbi:MAG TPA: hypothetical protein VFA27_07105 [Vicinamibacterales bacterium]|nr:hypothetical protein [Vicinamibacterales bacterium]